MRKLNRHERTIAVVVDELPGFDQAAAKRIGEYVAADGYPVRMVTAEELCRAEPHLLGFMLIVPCAASLPAPCAAPLRRYAAQGGQVLTLGGPLFGRLIREEEGRWEETPFDRGLPDATFTGAMGEFVWEGFTPTYKIYPLYGAESFRTESEQPIYEGRLNEPEQSIDGSRLNEPVQSNDDGRLNGPEQRADRDGLRTGGTALDLICPVARPHGLGYGHRRNNRYIPLVQAVGEGGRAEGRKGAAAFFMLHDTAGRGGSTSGTRPGSVTSTTVGSVTASIGILEQDLLSIPGAGELLLSMVRQMQRGLFLFEGGSDSFTCRAGKDGIIGASVLNATQDFVEVLVRFTVGTPDGVPIVQELPLLASPRNRSDIRLPWRDREARDDYTVTVELLYEGAVIDRIRHEAAVLEEREVPPLPDEFVSVNGDNFYLEGRPWYPVGMNYWPLYAPGMETEDYWAGWLDGRFYDPLEVERDLAYMGSLGINCLFTRLDGNVFDRSIPQLTDFIRRCGRRGMKLGLAFPAAMSPLYYSGAAVRRLMKDARLANNPVVFCYDIIWEFGMAVFHPQTRSYWDEDWERWIVERYGSPAQAERDWGMAARRNDQGGIAGPTQEQLAKDGEWRRMVAAYRRFADDWLSRKWNDAVTDLKSAAPHQLICCRQGPSGPQDVSFTATSKHIDFVCPEGYYLLTQGNSITPDEDGYNTLCAISRYLDYATGNKPIVWSEFGMSLSGVKWAMFEWDHDKLQPVEGSLERQAAYVELYCRMAVETKVNGVAPWWWAGGFRLGENSDFGLIGPDGSLRPSGALLRDYATGLSLPRTRPEPDVWTTVDRDAHAGGYWHFCYGEGKAAYADAARAGRWLGIRSDATGTNSLNTPLIAVGNVPYNGANPPKYLNAEFNRVVIIDARGGRCEVRDGGSVSVPAGEPLFIGLSVGNLQEAEWLAPGPADEAGGVYVTAAAGSELAVRIPIPHDVPRFGDADIPYAPLCQGITESTRVALRMEAKDRMIFGEICTFTLQAAIERTDD